MRGNRIVVTLELADTTKTLTKRSKTLFKSARKIYGLGWRKGSEGLHVDKKMLDYGFLRWGVAVFCQNCCVGFREHKKTSVWVSWHSPVTQIVINQTTNNKTTPNWTESVSQSFQWIMYARASCECKTSQSNRGPDVRKTSHNRHNALCFITKTKSCSLGWFNFRKDEKMTTLGYQASWWQLRFVTLIMHWTESQTLAFGRLKIYSYFSERKKFQVSTQVSVFNLCCNILQEILCCEMKPK